MLSENLTRRQVTRRIDRLALATHFKVQLDAIGIGAAHLGNLLTLFDRLIFLDQQRLVVGVSRQIGVVVLEDDEVAIAAQTSASVDHTAISRRNHGAAPLPADAITFVPRLIKATNRGTAARPDEVAAIPGAPALWAELRWAARAEGVVHLHDLLLRRVRLGLLLPRGGGDLMPHIRAIVQPELGWDDARWAAEERDYRALIAAAYALPRRSDIPNWNAQLAAARETRAQAVVARRQRGRQRQRRGGLGVLFVVWLLLLVLLLRRRARGEVG